MEFNQRLSAICSESQSLLCVGLDVEMDKIPEFIRDKKNAQLYFSQTIIEATLPYVAAYKINTAFFEVCGGSGWEAMKKIVAYLPADIIKIADAKRGDIGNSSKMYARAFFDEMNFDAITVNPYVGFDGVAPFLENKNKGAFFLCHTSNQGAADFQKFSNGKSRLFEIVAQQVRKWNVRDNCGLVVGATYPQEMKQVRDIAPDVPFLIPGLGAQGGDFALAVSYASQGGGAIFNFSRSIIFASSEKDFAQAAGEQARQMRDQINRHRTNKFNQGKKIE